MRTISALAAAALLVVWGAPAHADLPRITNTATAARTLFYEARTLMKQGRYDVACRKLEESLNLEYGIGTEFNLADCAEKMGRLSTAMARFRHVASAAREHRQPDRERIARERARMLDPRVPRLVIDVPGAAADLEVTRDGITVDRASWGTPLLVDPGAHRVTVSAPGKPSWVTSVEVGERAVVHVTVPNELVEPAPASSPVLVGSRAAEAEAKRNARQRTLGVVAGGVGLAGLAVGLGFGIDSLRQGERSKPHCVGDRCDARGMALREGAIRSGNVSTVATLAGAAAVAGGVVLFVTAQRAPPRTEPRAPALRALPLIAADGGGFYFHGELW